MGSTRSAPSTTTNRQRTSRRTRHIGGCEPQVVNQLVGGGDNVGEGGSMRATCEVAALQTHQGSSFSLQRRRNLEQC